MTASIFSSVVNRRSFMHKSALTAALAPMAASIFTGVKDANAAAIPPGPQLDLAILNFALNLEYLEANYYCLGVFGQTIDELGINTGSRAGAVTVRANPKVSFATNSLYQFAAEIAEDELAHIKFIQATIASLGGDAVSQPTLDLLNSFNTIAQNAGIAASFDPFADEVSFYLGGFSLTDVGVTAYHGSATSITNKDVLGGAAGLLAVESYHDATLRSTVFQAGADAQGKAQKISDLRDMLDDDNHKDHDQGVVDANGNANIVPADGNSIAFARTPRQVLNIVYGGFKAPSGGFFPSALNGPIK